MTDMDIHWYLEGNKALTKTEKMRVASRVGIKPYVVIENVTTGYGLCDMNGYIVNHGVFDNARDAIAVMLESPHGYYNDYERGYTSVYNRVTGERISDNHTACDSYGCWC